MIFFGLPWFQAFGVAVEVFRVISLFEQMQFVPADGSWNEDVGSAEHNLVFVFVEINVFVPTWFLFQHTFRVKTACCCWSTQNECKKAKYQ